MRFTVFIFLVLIAATVGGGAYLATADIAPPAETIEIDVPALSTSN